MEEELFQNQKEIAQAAHVRRWDEVRRLQDKLVSSYAAKTLAVRDVADVNSAAGIDGIKFTNDAQKMKAALSLTAIGYTPKPNRYMEVMLTLWTRLQNLRQTTVLSFPERAGLCTTLWHT